jgi:hypothetical protein
MYMVEVAMVTDLTTVMATTLVDHPSWVDLNHHHTAKATIHIDTNHTPHGAQVVTDLSTATEAQEVAKVLL